MTSNRRFNVAVMPGDGIGPEVTDAALAVLDAAVGANAGFTLEYEHLAAGAAALDLVRKPWEFDVMVTENMFGDILSDLAAALVGGMGMAPSADIGDGHALFQPAHGSAPDIAGRGVANPIATIQSAAMMLDWLAERHEVPACAEAARRIDAAVAAVLAEGRARPVDLGGADGTEAVTRAVVEALGQSG